MENLGDTSFDRFLKKNKVVLVDFWAEWCGPCRMLAPVLEELSKEYGGKVAFAKVNVDECRETSQRFEIMSIPTLILFKDGKAVDKLIGAVPMEQIKEFISKHM